MHVGDTNRRRQVDAGRIDEHAHTVRNVTESVGEGGTGRVRRLKTRSRVVTTYWVDRSLQVVRARLLAVGGGGARAVDDQDSEEDAGSQLHLRVLMCKAATIMEVYAVH